VQTKVVLTNSNTSAGLNGQHRLFGYAGGALWLGEYGITGGVAKVLRVRL